MRQQFLKQANQYNCSLCQTNKHFKGTKPQYDRRTAIITLTCFAIGNPDLTYIWYKEEKTRYIIGWTNIYIIENVDHICEAYNTIDAIDYETTYSIEIDIGKQAMFSGIFRQYMKISNKLYRIK